MLVSFSSGLFSFYINILANCLDFCFLVCGCLDFVFFVLSIVSIFDYKCFIFNGSSRFDGLIVCKACKFAIHPLGFALVTY